MGRQSVSTTLMGRKVKFADGLANKALAGKTGKIRTAYMDGNHVWYQIEVDGFLTKSQLNSIDDFEPRILPEEVK